MLNVNLKIATSVSLLIALVGLFQISLAISPHKGSCEKPDTNPRTRAVLDYRYLRGGIFLILLACLTEYFILLFNFYI